MKRIGKGYNLSIISLLISVVLLCNATLYAHSQSNYSLRVSVGQKDTYDRIANVIEREVHGRLIDSNLDSAHKEDRAHSFYARHPDIIKKFSWYLKDNGLEETMPLLVALQEEGLWLVTPKKGEALPIVHASDRGIHITDFPGVDLAKACANGMAGYIGLPHWMAEPFAEDFATFYKKIRETLIYSNTFSEDLRKQFLEMLEQRKKDKKLLTSLSETEEKDGIYQRYYAPLINLNAFELLKVPSTSTAQKRQILNGIPDLLEHYPNLATEANLKLVLEMLKDSDMAVRIVALRDMPHFIKANEDSLTEANLKLVLEMLKDSNMAEPSFALRVIPYFITENKKANKDRFTKSNLKLVLKMLKNPDGPVRSDALKVIPYFIKANKAFTTKPILKLVLKRLKDPRWYVVAAAKKAIPYFTEENEDNRKFVNDFHKPIVRSILDTMGGIYRAALAAI